MFGLGMPEILLILAIALIVIGPQKLPELAKTLGRAMGEFKRSAQDFKRSIDIETTIQDPVPAPSKKVKEIIKDVNSDKKTETEAKESTEKTPAPETGDTPSAPASEDKDADSQSSKKESTND
ncbi:MAG: twin-arginine translocase TatA/TatE family subunit [Desulfobacter sp.]|nr:MAG: twin-arginine translocase TatA/TatE family subunit [Desulfobacter sp.]